MTRRILAAALVLVFAVGSQAQRLQRRVVAEGAPEGIAGVSLSRALPDPGEVVIELEATPLLLRDPSLRSSASAELDGLFERLERDLATIRGETRATTQAEPPRAPLLRHRYRLAFAGAAARVDPESIERIRRLDYVRRVHPDWISTAYLAASIAAVGAPEVWRDYGARGEGVTVAVVDTGIDYTHPAFGGGFGPQFRVRGGRDFVNDDADPMDDHGHGTHVAGIVAANGGGLLGVAPGAALLAYKVLDHSGIGRDSSILAAIEAAIRDGADIVNMSLGKPAAADDPVSRAVETASMSGILFCVAAGNSGKFLDIGSPGNAPSALTVGAADQAGRVAFFSSKGPVVPTGAIKPEVVAPGVAILSAAPGGGTLTASGTSMAAPHAAGVAALLRSIHPEWTGGTLRAALIASARPVAAEVMARGAGSIHALDAAAVRAFPVSSALSFGIAGGADETWTSRRGIDVINRSAESQSFSVEIDGLRNGIEMTPSVGSFAVAPGESARVDLELVVDHSRVPAAAEGSLSFGGTVRLVGQAFSLSVPWSFVKASTVRVRWTGPELVTVRVGTARMMVEGWTSPENRTVDLFVGAGQASLWVQTRSGSVARHVLREDLDLAAASEYTLGPDDARHRLRLRGTDLHGRLLSDRGDLSLTEIAIRHPHFESRLIDNFLLVLPGQDVLLSDLSENTRLLAFERAFDLAPAVTWVAQYPPVVGVAGDVELTLDPDAWSLLSARSVIPADLESPYQAVFAAVWLFAARQAAGSVVAPLEALLTAPDPEARAYLIRSEPGDAATSVRIEIGESPTGESPPGGIPRAELIAEFTGVEGGLIPGRRQEPRLSDRITPSGEAVVIGDGPVHPMSGVLGWQSMVLAIVQWIGPQSEERPYDVKRMTGELFDAEGTLIASGVAPPGQGALAFQLQAEVPGPGRYRFEAVNRSADVAGLDARATLTATFDTAAEDPAPPTLTSLRVTDATGRAASTLGKGSAGTLSFSALDFSLSGFGAVQKEKTALHYRARGAGDGWVALTPLAWGEDLGSSAEPGRQPDGILFRADLSDVTANVTGAVDVRISIEDPSGNRTVYVMEPGFVIEGRARTRPVIRP